MEKPPCHSNNHSNNHSHCHSNPDKPDYLLRVSFFFVILFYLLHLSSDFLEKSSFLPDPFNQSTHPLSHSLTHSLTHALPHAVFELLNTVWIGVLIGILMIAILSRIPREFVISILGTKKSGRLNGILRATLAGVLLDLCSHGILMVGAKLYERGASAGQVMAFLIASPWNSFSLTLILISLIGLFWTLTFIALSMLIAIIVGLLVDILVQRQHLPENPNQITLPENFNFWQSTKQGLSTLHIDGAFIKQTLLNGIKESRMVLRWILFGILLASLLRAFIPPETFGSYFGPTLAGLGLTLLAATLIEVCSEGSSPIAADLLTRANAPGNSFAFLMTGVSTDYTEIMILKESTKSWKIALALPLLTIPQVIALAWLMNSVPL